MALQGEAIFTQRLTETNQCQGFKTIGEDDVNFFLKVIIGPDTYVDIQITEEAYNTIRELNNEQARRREQESTEAD